MGNNQEVGLETNKLDYFRKVMDSTDERRSWYVHTFPLLLFKRLGNLSVPLELQPKPSHSHVITSPWESDSKSGAISFSLGTWQCPEPSEAGGGGGEDGATDI